MKLTTFPMGEFRYHASYNADTLWKIELQCCTSRPKPPWATSLQSSWATSLGTMGLCSTKLDLACNDSQPIVSLCLDDIHMLVVLVCRCVRVFVCCLAFVVCGFACLFICCLRFVLCAVCSFVWFLFACIVWLFVVNLFVGCLLCWRKRRTRARRRRRRRRKVHCVNENKDLVNCLFVWECQRMLTFLCCGGSARRESYFY